MGLRLLTRISQMLLYVPIVAASHVMGAYGFYKQHVFKQALFVIPKT